MTDKIKEAVEVFQKLLDYECWDGDWMLKLQEAVADGHLQTVVKQAAASGCEVVTPTAFNHWMTDRFNEYFRAGIDDASAPNYEPSEVIVEFIKDYSECFPNGLKLSEAAGGENV